MTQRKRHPHKAIEQSIRYAEKTGWRFIPAGKSAHAWGLLQCPNNDGNCRCGRFCQNCVWSTPRNPEAHARQIRKWVDSCIYQGENND